MKDFSALYTFSAPVVLAGIYSSRITLSCGQGRRFGHKNRIEDKYPGRSGHE
jgi:hypothetical protein